MLPVGNGGPSVPFPWEGNSTVEGGLRTTLEPDAIGFRFNAGPLTSKNRAQSSCAGSTTSPVASFVNVITRFVPMISNLTTAWRPEASDPTKLTSVTGVAVVGLAKRRKKPAASAQK